ncbi:MAG: hypothetical protein AAB885_02040 [Patescibacteria group bacterium]
MQRNTILKKIGLVALLFVLLPTASFALDVQAKAESSWWNPAAWVEGFFTWTSNAIVYVVNYIAAALIGYAAVAIKMLLDLSRQLTNLDFVKEGFKVVLSLTNLGFVLAIIVIAIATILRIENYAIKKTLWKLIVAALLVNFSFVLVTPIISFSNTLGFFFIKATVPDGPGTASFENYTSNLANALNIQKLSLNTPAENSLSGAVLAFSKGYLQTIATSALVLIFNVGLVLSFWGLAFMLLIRNIYLMILLVLMPLAWLMWIFPAYEKHWKEWWETFFKWNLFFPAVAFFLYLSILTSQSLGEVIKGTSENASTAIKQLSFLDELGIVAGLQVLVQIFILGFGIGVAHKMGIDGSEGIMKMTGAARGWITGMAGKLARAPLKGAAMGAAAAGKEYGTRPAKFGARLLSSALSSPLLRRIPGATGAANALAGIGQRQGEVEEYQKKNFANLSKEQFESYMKSPPLGPIAQAAVLAEAAKRGMIGKFTPEQLEKLANAAKATNPGMPPEAIPTIKEILAVDPTLAPKLTVDSKTGKSMSIVDAMKKMADDKFDQIEKDALKNRDVLLNINPGKMAAGIRKGNQSLRDTLKTELEKILVGTQLAAVGEAIAKTMKELKDAKQIGDKTETQRLQLQLKTFRTTLQSERNKATADQGSAYDKLALFNQIIGNP